MLRLCVREELVVRVEMHTSAARFLFTDQVNHFRSRFILLIDVTINAK